MKFTLSAAMLALLAAACGTDEPQMAANDSDDPDGRAARGEQAGPVFFFGTVHHLPQDGGTWVVRTAGGTQYQPIQLPAEFQVDGIAVEVQALKHDGAAAQDTLGPTIDIIEIRKR